jgi:hypothetical protein
MPKALERAARAGDGWYGPMVKPEEAIGYKQTIEKIRNEHGLTGPYSYQARVWGEPSIAQMQAYVDAGFDTLVVPSETLQGPLDFDMTLDQKKRRLDEIAKNLGVGR